MLFRSEKGDLYYGGKKVSGSAYAFSRDKALHHASLLLQSELEKLDSVLKSRCSEAISGNRVFSRPAAVTNLFPNADIDFLLPSLCHAILDSLSQNMGSEKIGPDIIHPLHMISSQEVHALSKWDRVFGKTPDFTYTQQDPKQTVFLTIKKGRIVSCCGENGMDVTGPMEQRFDEYLCQQTQTSEKNML